MKTTVLIQQNGDTKISLHPETHLERELMKQIRQGKNVSTNVEYIYPGRIGEDTYLAIKVEKREN